MKLTDREFLLLRLVCDRKNAVDHELTGVLPCRDGTDSGPVSPTALDNLMRRKLVPSSGIPGQDRGSPAGEFEITCAGKELLQQEIVAVLASTRERDCRFDLALAASGLVPMPEVLAALAKRKSYLTEVAAGLQARFNVHKQPLHLRALFEHPLSVVQCEIGFMDMLIQALSSIQPPATCTTVLPDAP